MLRIKFLLMVKISLQQLKQISSCDTINLKSVVKFCVSTWFIFADPVTYAIMIIDKCYTNNMLVLHLYNTKFQEDMYVQYAYIIIIACVNSWVIEMSGNSYSGLQM